MFAGISYQNLVQMGWLGMGRGGGVKWLRVTGPGTTAQCPEYRRSKTRYPSRNGSSFFFFLSGLGLFSVRNDVSLPSQKSVPKGQFF